MMFATRNKLLKLCKRDVAGGKDEFTAISSVLVVVLQLH